MKRLLVVAVSLMVTSPGAEVSQTPGGSAMAWTGTVTVERRASGSLRAAPNATIGFTG